MGYRKKTLYKLNTFIGCMIFFCGLQLLYNYIIQPIWAYAGFIGDFDAGRCVVSWICYIPVACVVSKASSNKKVSWIISSLILICAYAPGLILNIYAKTDFFNLFIMYYAVFIIALIVIDTVRVKEFFYLKDDRILDLFGFFLGLIIMFIWVRYTHCHMQISLLNVYGQRKIASTYSYPTIFRYIFSMSKSVIPLLAVYDLYEGKVAKAIYYAVIQYIGFCIDASKSAVFMFVLTIAMYYIIRHVHNYIASIPWLLIAGIIVGFLEKTILKTIYISGVLYRRVLFVPALLNYDYYNFFKENPFDYFRQSLSFLGTSPYIKSIPGVIGEFNGSGSNANNGLFSDAYANLGILGMIIMPIMIILIFKIIEISARNLPAEITVSVVIITVITYISSSYFTNLLSHGIALIIIVLLMIPKRKMKERLAGRGI